MVGLAATVFGLADRLEAEPLLACVLMGLVAANQGYTPMPHSLLLLYCSLTAGSAAYQLQQFHHASCSCSSVHFNVISCLLLVMIVSMYRMQSYNMWCLQVLVVLTVETTEGGMQSFPRDGFA